MSEEHLMCHLYGAAPKAFPIQIVDGSLGVLFQGESGKATALQDQHRMDGHISFIRLNVGSA